MTEVLILGTLPLVLIWLLAYYLSLQRALRWWFQRQSTWLANEAEKIRDDLLQESFALRRFLEQSCSEAEVQWQQSNQSWVETLENLHLSLDRLSDRLSPPYIEHSLPLTIEWVVQSWQASHPRVQFKTELLVDWPDELTQHHQHHLVVVKVLDELLRITTAVDWTEITVWLDRKPKKAIGELILYISFPNEAALFSYAKLKELQYLSQTFRLLSSGRCSWSRRELTVTWCFCWSVAKVELSSRRSRLRDKNDPKFTRPEAEDSSS